MNNNSNNKAFKSAIWYTISNFFVRSIGLLTTPLFTRLLSKSDFGLYNNYTSWLLIVTIVVTLNLEATLISAKYDYGEKFDEYIVSVLSLSSFSTGVFMVIVNIFAPYFERLFNLQMIYINSIFVYLLFQPAINFYLSRERFLFEYKKSVLVSILLALSTSLFSVVLVVVFDNKFAGRVLGLVIPTLIIGIICYVIIVRAGKKISIKYWKYAIPICLPYIPHLLSMTVLNVMDKIMITRYCGSEANAIYSLAYTCGSLVSLLISSLNNAFVPWLGEKLHEQKYNEIKQFSKKFIILFYIGAIWIMLIAPEVLLVLGGESYADAKFVMIPVALGCVYQFIYTLYVNVEQYMKRTAGMALASISAAVINYVLNYCFIPTFGYQAAAYTTLAGYLWLLFVHMYLVKKIGLHVVYSDKSVFFVVGSSIGLLFVITFLYNNSLIRYGFIIFGILIGSFLLYKYKAKIIKYVKR